MKRLIENIGMRALRSVDPEQAHGLAIKALKTPLAPAPGAITSARLTTSVAGLHLPNPVGLAAGFDKNAEAIAPLSKVGFGFLEVGAATPQAQPGNPKPRLFRLTEDAAAINRFGFNNQGMERVRQRLAEAASPVPLGLNLGANKDSTDKSTDFAKVLAHCGPHLDFATVNVSSPNTEKLRDLQGAEALAALLAGVNAANEVLENPIPIFLKIAPDLNDAEISEIADVAREAGLSAIIATNTTLSRDGLKSADKDQMGGLSGKPLFDRSTRVLAKLYHHTQGEIPLIGVGGISSGRDALTKIEAGASAVQLYTAMVYSGISLIEDIVRDLDSLLANQGVTALQDVIGTRVDHWL